MYKTQEAPAQGCAGAFLLYNIEIWDIMEVGSYTYGGIVMERNIKYQYFKMDSQIKLNGNWVDEGAFDFIGWIDYINKNALEQETIKLKDTKARIEKIEFLIRLMYGLFDL